MLRALWLNLLNTAFDEETCLRDLPVLADSSRGGISHSSRARTDRDDVNQVKHCHGERGLESRGEAPSVGVGNGPRGHRASKIKSIDAFFVLTPPAV